MLKVTRPEAAGTRDCVTYAMALRVIGQNLTGLALEFLEITQDGEVFVARGRMSTGSAREPFLRRYGPAEIARLDEIGAAQKTGAEKKPDASSLAESLRTVGRIIDEKRGQLIKLRKDERKITFEYEDENGRHTDEHYRLALYQEQQNALSMETGKKKRDVWDDSW